MHRTGRVKGKVTTQPVIAFSKLTQKTQKQGEKYVQS